jgi:hypothetical protein
MKTLTRFLLENIDYPDSLDNWDFDETGSKTSYIHNEYQIEVEVNKNGEFSYIDVSGKNIKGKFRPNDNIEKVLDAIGKKIIKDQNQLETDLDRYVKKIGWDYDIHPMDYGVTIVDVLFRKVNHGKKLEYSATITDGYLEVKANRMDSKSNKTMNKYRFDGKIISLAKSLQQFEKEAETKLLGK